MVTNRSIGFQSLLVCLQLALVTLSYWGWLALWEPSLFQDRTGEEKYLLYNEFLLIGVLFGARGKRHTQGPHHEFVDAIRRSWRQALLGLFAVFALVIALQDTFVSRSFLLSYVPWMGLTLLFSNYLGPVWLGRWAFAGVREERVVLAGTAEQALKIQPWLERKRLIGLNPIGVVCPNGEGKANGKVKNGAIRVLGSLDQMDQIFKQEAITQLIVLDLSLGPERLRNLTQLCEEASVRILAVDGLDSYFNHTTMIFEDDGVRLIALREEPLENPTNRMIKRMVDLLVAAPIVFLVLPIITVFVWVIQRAQSPGPIIFRQARIGMRGETFEMWKYRTMHMNHGNEAKQATQADNRIFPAGRWMRKLSIDELPQFINVLKGDMSVVGPRPHMRKHEELWIAAMRKYVIRRYIRPGITGYAQVKGFRGEVRSLADIHNRVERDIHYLENWSLSLDLVIIFQTAKECIFPPKSAY